MIKRLDSDRSSSFYKTNHYLSACVHDGWCARGSRWRQPSKWPDKKQSRRVCAPPASHSKELKEKNNRIIHLFATAAWRVTQIGSSVNLYIHDYRFLVNCWLPPTDNAYRLKRVHSAWLFVLLILNISL